MITSPAPAPAAPIQPAPAPAAPRPKASTLYIQVIIGVLIGGAFGYFWPDQGKAMKPIGDAFINLIKMLIGPIIFCTVVAGLAGMNDLKRLGRVGGKALLYFEVITTLALVIGLVVSNVFQPGAGLHAVPTADDLKKVSAYAGQAAQMGGVVDYLMHIIPKTFVSAFAEGEILQVLLLAVLFGIALGRLGDYGRPIMNLLNDIARVFFGIVTIITKAAPLAAAGAMAFTIGAYGIKSLWQLGQLMACVYLTCAVFIFGVLGVVARLNGFSVWKIIKHIREELAIVVGTSSSESGLPGLMDKMERAGCARQVVGVVVPAGYSFNLDGTCIYLTMAALFLTQATDHPLDLGKQLGLLAILLLTSKGASGVTGSGFIVLAATLAGVKDGPTILVPAMAMILGIDRFMSEARTITNFIGNAVATLVISKWEGALDDQKAAIVKAGR